MTSRQISSAGEASRQLARPRQRGHLGPCGVRQPGAPRPQAARALLYSIHLLMGPAPDVPHHVLTAGAKGLAPDRYGNRPRPPSPDPELTETELDWLEDVLAVARFSFRARKKSCRSCQRGGKSVDSWDGSDRRGRAGRRSPKERRDQTLRQSTRVIT